jgi:hypothetical protein
VVSRRVARWLEFLGRFKYTIVYKPGATNPADPLSRKPVVALTFAKLAALDRQLECTYVQLAVATRAQARREQGLPEQGRPRAETRTQVHRQEAAAVPPAQGTPPQAQDPPLPGPPPLPPPPGVTVLPVTGSQV